jgi:hypothetical protein
MSTYLEDYLEKIRGLPPQIQRNLNLIKDLDEVKFAWRAWLWRCSGHLVQKLASACSTV